MPQYLPNQIDDANLAYYYTEQQTSHGIYYRLNGSNDQFPPGFYASQRYCIYAIDFLSTSLLTVGLGMLLANPLPVNLLRALHPLCQQYTLALLYILGSRWIIKSIDILLFAFGLTMEGHP